MNTYIINETNGLLVNPNSAEDIAQKTISILLDSALKESTRKNARNSVEQFDSKRLSKKESDFYLRILENAQDL